MFVDSFGKNGDIGSILGTFECDGKSYSSGCSCDHDSFVGERFGGLFVGDLLLNEL